jgi:hypothetical protein
MAFLLPDAMPTNRSPHGPLYWLVLGVLTADNKLVRSPGFTSKEVPAPILDPQSPLRAEVLDANGRPLLRAGIPLATPCSDGPGATPSSRLVSGMLPLPEETAIVRFLLDDILLEEYRVPEGQPRTVLTAVPEPGAVGKVTITWASDHPGRVPLTHAVGFSADDGQTWDPIGLPIQRNELELDLDALPGGERCRVCVKTTDGVHMVAAVSEPFPLPLKPCVPMILAPEPELELALGATLRLQGQGYWREERRPEFDALSWSSSLVGALGRGAIVEVSGLTPGKHEITLLAGNGERTGRASITITVG